MMNFNLQFSVCLAALFGAENDEDIVGIQEATNVL
jgi:hypothetical protein